MSWRLPPLNPLKAFEAAGRHSSLKKAAAELSVTEAAVSRQVRLLERSLGIQLFERRHRAVVLTGEGRRFLADASDAFAKLDSATARLRASRQREVLRIFAYPTFAMRWLMPRLSQFHALHPSIEVQLSVSHGTVDFRKDGVDGAIRSGDGHWPDLAVVRLFPYVLVPVCTPRLIDAEHRLREPRDLARCTLLHSLVRPDDWSLWLNAAGVGGEVDPARGLHFQSPSLAYEAALEGMGVAIAQPSLVAGELAAGKLVAPFPLRVELDECYYFVSPRDAPEKASVVAFRELLLQQL